MLLGNRTKVFGYIKCAKKLRLVGMFSVFSFVLLSFLSVFPIVHHEDQAEADYVPSVSNITITSASNTASVDVTPLSKDGTFAASTAASEVAFNVTTNNLTGYNLSLNGSDSTGSLINNATSDTLETIASATDANTFATGATSTYTDKWGIKPNKLNGANNTNYLPAPTTTNAITLDSTTTPNTTANSYTIGLGARLDYARPAGAYTNTFVLTAVGNPISYQINYNDTTGDSVADMPMEGESNISASGFKLSSTVPTRTGYTFNKWCEGTVTHTNLGNSTCSGTQYAAGASYSFSSISGSSINTANLYAMWNVNTYNVKVNFAGSGVSNVAFTASGQTTRTVSTSGGTATLTYGVPYTMTMSLTSGSYVFSSWALNSTSYGTLSSTSTNPATFTANANSSSAIITATGEAKLWFQSATNSDCGKTMYDNRGTAAYKDIAYGTAKIDDLCYMTRNLDLPSGTTLTSSDSNVSANYALPTSDVYNSNNTTCASGTPCYSYYSYAAVTAGTNPSSGDATSDICPKGWRLPTSAELTTLKNTYTTGATLAVAPFRGVYAGNYSGSSFGGGGSSVYYWSSTARNASYAYSLYFTSSYASIGSSAKNYLSGVRCVRLLDTRTISNITSMQSIIPRIVTNTANGATATLTDSRDNKSYTVAKIDGRVWMTKNLDLAGGKTLTSADSNVSANYTLPASGKGSTSFSNSNTAYVYNSGSTSCTSSSPCYSYYSWVAATAGTNPSSGDSTSDICPKGWRLPTEGELKALGKAYSNLTAAPFKGVLAGDYTSGGSFGEGGSAGVYWSSTNRDVGAYSFWIYSSSYGNVYEYKNKGFSIRCVAKT